MKEKVEKIVVVHEPCEIEISGATLLTADEAKSLLTINDRACELRWWLRSPGHGQHDAATVDDDGSVHAYGDNVSHGSVGVRPALKIENLASTNLKIGDEFYIGRRHFKIISNHLALCDSFVGYSRFDAKSNDYESSEIKAVVDNWFAEICGREASPAAIDAEAQQVNDISGISVCPFCGGAAKAYAVYRGEYDSTRTVKTYGVKCAGCGVRYDAVFPSAEDAIAAWNLRAKEG